MKIKISRKNKSVFILVGAMVHVGCIMETHKSPPKILFLGNSITQSIRNDTAGWKLEAGMAASSSDKDYVHQTIRILKDKGFEFEAIIGSRDCNICDGVIGEHLENIGEIQEMHPRYVVVQLGENSNQLEVDSGRLTKDYLALISAIHYQSIHGIFCITNWNEANLSDAHNDAILRAVSHFPDIHVVDITALANQPENYGDSTLYHNPAILWHPGDLGMLRIAEALSHSILAEE